MTESELRALVQLLRERGRPERLDVDEMRARYELLGERFPAPREGLREPLTIEGRTAEFIAAPEADPERHILYLHGGGYVLGSLDTHRNLAWNLSQAAAARVLLLDYRLAPENPFPAAVEDAVAAYRWLLAQNVDPARTAIAGDSAGGGLTVSTLVVLGDDGDPRPACGVCISPWTDMAGAGASMAANAAEDPVIWSGAIDWFADLYLGGADPKLPLASPLHADLAGLPPLLIQVGSTECLLDDAVRLAQRARAAGVAVEIETVANMPHVWHMFAPILSEAREAVARAGAFIRARTGGEAGEGAALANGPEPATP